MNADLIIPDFHVPEHDELPRWHPERIACATCTPDEVIEAMVR